jgi:ribosomal protein L37E
MVAVAVLRGGAIVFVDRDVKQVQPKRNVKRLHKCSKCGVPHNRKSSNVNPDLCADCAKGQSQAKHREKMCVKRAVRVGSFLVCDSCGFKEFA